MLKANSELFTLTYGVLVNQLISDYEDIQTVNDQLEKMGWNIGVRLIDEYFSKVALVSDAAVASSCSSFTETAESIAKIGFKMFLGISCEVANVTNDGKAFSLYMQDNPLSVFVELPTEKVNHETHFCVILFSLGIISNLSAAAASASAHPCPYLQEDLKYSNLICGVISGALSAVNLRVKATFVRDVLWGDEVNEIRVELLEKMSDDVGEAYKEE